MNQKEEVKKILMDLKDSPVLTKEFQMTIDNLCGVVSHLSTGVILEIENFNDDLKEKKFDFLGKKITSLIYRLYEIETVADIIKEKVFHEDIDKLCDLVSYMQEIEEFKN